MAHHQVASEKVWSTMWEKRDAIRDPGHLLPFLFQVLRNKIGNVYLKWAFSEAVLWMLRYSDEAKAFLKRKEKKHSKARAMTMLSRKIARAVYQMLKRKEPFDEVKFFAS